MRLTEVDFGGGVPIDGYGPGFFRIAGEVQEGHALVLPDQVAVWGGYGDWEAILSAKGAFDVLFIGTGPDVAHIPPEDRAMLEAEGIAFDLMASAAACRTYNVLLSEGRRVAAALIAL